MKTYINYRQDSKEYWLFPIFNLLAFISVFFYNIRAGALACIIIFLFYLNDSRYLCVLKDFPFMLYIVIACLSVQAYLYNGRPLQLFLICISYNLIPMLMYGIGKACKMEEHKVKTYEGLLISNIVILIIGLLIYLIPEIASRLDMESMATAGIDINYVGYRFGSYLDSLTMGSICAINIPIIFLLNIKKTYQKYICLMLTVCGLLLTMQRGAWIVGIAGLFGCMVISIVYKKEGNAKTLVSYLMIIVFIGVILVFFSQYFISDSLMQYLQIRLARFELANMMNERYYQVERAFNTFLEYPLGFGLGAAGIKAASYGLQIVPDGNHLKILVETGILGFLVFIFLNLRGIYRGLKSKRYYSTLVVCLFLCHAIGSNVLDFYYSSFVYWFALGYINSLDESANVKHI